MRIRIKELFLQERKIKTTIVIAIIITISFGLFLHPVKWIYKRYDEVEFKDSINGKIVLKFTDHGLSFFKIEDKKYFIGSSFNKHEGKTLSEFIQTGDSISKNWNSCDFYVYRNDSIFLFQMHWLKGIHY